MKTILLMTFCLTVSFFANAGTSKSVKAIERQKVEFNLVQFCKYLEDGNPSEGEGIYTTTDHRYFIAIVKNNENSHDYIGVVISADNPYWEKGEVRFNFVKNNDDRLNGFYYNSRGEEFPLELKIKDDTLQTNFLKRLDVNELRAEMVALL